MSDESAKLPALPKGRYRHSKTNRLYQVIGVATGTEDDHFVVVYRPLYESPYELFTRPFDMFTESIVIDGKNVPRFQYVGEELL